MRFGQRQLLPQLRNVSEQRIDDGLSKRAASSTFPHVTFTLCNPDLRVNALIDCDSGSSQERDITFTISSMESAARLPVVPTPSRRQRIAGHRAARPQVQLRLRA